MECHVTETLEVSYNKAFRDENAEDFRVSLATYAVFDKVSLVTSAATINESGVSAAGRQSGVNRVGLMICVHLWLQTP
jgi:hypothetical protein